MTHYGEIGFGKNCEKFVIIGKMWRMMKNMSECARSSVMLDGEISKYVDIYKESHRCVLDHPIYSRYILMTQL